MKKIHFDDLDALQAMISDNYGPWSESLELSQKMIDAFAELTGDYQWIHTDVERARKESPLESTIAHGFLLLSLSAITKNAADFEIVGHSSALNYGLDQVRFISPVLSGSSFHGRTRVVSAAREKGGVMLTKEVAMHVIDREKPALVFKWKLLYRA